MDADGFGDGGHVQGAEVGGAGFEELALVADDFVGDCLDGLLALMDGADEEFAAADFFANVLADVLAAADLAEDVFVGVADAEVGQVVIVHDGDPFFALLFDDDVGIDVGVGGDGEALGGAGVEGADEVGGAGDLLDGYAEAAGHDGVAFVGEVFEVLFDEAVGEAVFFAEAFELDDEALAEVFGADADGVEALEDVLGGDEVVKRDGVGEAEVFEAGVEEAVVPEIADEELGVGDEVGVGDVEGAKLGDEVLLEGGGSDDGVHHVLPAFLVVTAAVVVDHAGLSPVVAPFVVHLGDGVEVIRIIGIVGDGVIERDFGGFEFEDGVDLDFLLDDLAQFEGGGLKDLQALLHLWTDRQFLSLGLVESLVGHGWMECESVGTDTLELVYASSYWARFGFLSRTGW